MNIMKNTVSNMVLAVGAVLILGGIAAVSMSEPGLVINGDPVSGLAGVGLAMVGGVIALIATFFALSFTGLLLAGIAVFLALLVLGILGTLALALSPLLLPIMLLAGVLVLIGRHSRRRNP
jgi:hypothetical protein